MELAIGIAGLSISLVALTLSLVSGFKLFERSHWNSAKGIVFWLWHRSLTFEENTKVIVNNTSSVHGLSQIECYLVHTDGDRRLIASVGYIPPGQQVGVPMSQEAHKYPTIGSDLNLEVLQNERLALQFSTGPRHRWERALDGSLRRVKEQVGKRIGRKQ